MSNRRQSRTFGRAWRESEFDDEGVLLVDVPPPRCPRCCRLLDLGQLDDIDVHRCEFCQTRTRWLWSDRRDIAVEEVRGLNPDWWVEDELWLWRDYDPYEETEEDEWRGSRCANGCEDPVFGGPVPEIEVRERWVCAMCGASTEDDGGDADDDSEDDAH